ncbi:MAG: HAD family hydrolase [Hespellia sp.]|nr:HAD family hydrolase [Hespellia sp.]
MTSEILNYCKKNKIECIFLDFFGTIVQRNCAPEEVKYLWAKKLALELKYSVDEEWLLMIRKKSEQAVRFRAKANEFNYLELTDEIYRRIIDLNSIFESKYNAIDFYNISHNVEIQAELESQNYIRNTIDLINEAYLRKIHVNIISDFYLGEKELKIFLGKEEVYKKIENIFVSSDCRMSKFSGGMYEYACRQVGFKVEQCIMVGDNPESDIQNAEAHGIRGFLLNYSDGENQRKRLDTRLEYISKKNISGVYGYSNYCFLLYLYIERLYKSLICEDIQDIYFLSREGEFLKELFDLYISKRNDDRIHTHYLYVSRKATYPATLKALGEEKFELLRKFREFSIMDFFENIGMASVVSKLELKKFEIEKPIDNFFDSLVYQKICERKDFQELYESSRVQYNRLFRKYCKQEGLITNHTVAVADVGWNGTMQDNIYNALGGIGCVGFYIGLINSAYSFQQSKKRGLIFSENPQNSSDLELWKYDHVFLERILWASHGATDYYKEENNHVCPVFKDYPSEETNYKLMKPIQEEILKKFEELDNVFLQSSYSAENVYKDFLDYHLHMLFIVNNQQLELQRKMIKGQMQNFGHISTAGDSIGTTFSKKRILKKIWNNLRIFKNSEIMFRILLNYNQKFAIKMLYCFRYLRRKRRKWSKDT